MSFPLSITGSINIEKEFSGAYTVDSVAARIEGMLNQSYATRVIRNGGVLTFKAAPVAYQRQQGRSLTQYGPGTIEVSKTSENLVVSYTLSTTQLLIFSIIVNTLIPAAIILCAWHQNHIIEYKFLSLIPVGFLLTFGVNYFIEMNWFSSWLKDGFRGG